MFFVFVFFGFLCGFLVVVSLRGDYGSYERDSEGKGDSFFYSGIYDFIYIFVCLVGSYY